MIWEYSVIIIHPRASCSICLCEFVRETQKEANYALFDHIADSHPGYLQKEIEEQKRGKD